LFRCRSVDGHLNGVEGAAGWWSGWSLNRRVDCESTVMGVEDSRGEKRLGWSMTSCSFAFCCFVPVGGGGAAGSGCGCGGGCEWFTWMSAGRWDVFQPSWSRCWRRFEQRVLGDFRFVEISRDSWRSPEIFGDSR
jgi:hypothetical protein